MWKFLCWGFCLALASPAIFALELNSAMRLSIRSAGADAAVISWSSAAGRVVLESSDRLVDSVWTPVNAVPAELGQELSITITAADSARFYRLLASQLSPVTISSSSPASGETGVAVTRETVIHFSGPLATNASVNTSNFFAGFGGRPILSRVELASDRTKATLFYLEPLPGSTRMVVVFDGDAVLGENGLPIDGDGDGVPGGQAIITFETLSLTALPNTAVIGTVYASELVPGSDTGTNANNKPLAGVTITVDGMEQTLRAVTDTNGNFKLSPVPPGRFFVHIDGRTVRDPAASIRYPDQSYYPFVGKAWEAVAGREDNLAGGNGKIYLPLITAGTLQPVSLTNDTVITFPTSVVSNNPALAGVSITVPANSLFSENGTRGGRVGIAAVPPDRLPEPLPAGLEMPIVITVQTDGALNFDRPAPICFPNLPDPVLKTPLPAGSKQALIVFNHDKGIWEAQGSMTVSSDGRFVCSDPGTGILQPGWSGVGPTPSQPPPNDGDLPKCKPISKSECEQDCNRYQKNCRENALIFFEYMMERCRNPLPPRQDCYYHHGEPRPCGATASGSDCERDATLEFQKYLAACSQALEECHKACDECHAQLPSPTTGGSLQALTAGNLAFESDPTGTEIYAILETIAGILRPSALGYSEVLPEVRDEIERLLSRADSLAGGRAASYLNALAIRNEEREAEYAQNIGLQLEQLVPGNAPPYPVHYAAVLVRRDKQIVLRGKTEPFGQYSIFVPRDGALIGVSFYDSKTKRFGSVNPYAGPSPRFRLPPFSLFALPDNEPDFDADGLANVVEDIYGTGATAPDSDRDGIPDAAEIAQGTNPLDGIPVSIGLLGTARTPGSALDVAAGTDLLAVAQGTAGVSILDISGGINPVLAAHLDTPGNAQEVAMSGSTVAVADGEFGVAVIDISQPDQARIVHQVHLGGNAQSVAAAGRYAYAAVIGPSLGPPLDVPPAWLVKVDLATGLPIEKHLLPHPIQMPDVAVAGGHVFVVTLANLFIFGEGASGLALISQLPTGGTGPDPQIFAGGGLAYVSSTRSYLVFDVSNAAQPSRIGQSLASLLGLQHVISTGSGMVVGTASPTGPAGHQIGLFDGSTPTVVTNFLTLLDTPGEVRGVTIYNGLASLADFSAGVQVLNFQPFDRDGQAPAASLSIPAGTSVENNRPMRITVNAVDDVQVRNVELHIDGQRAFTDGNFPFEFVFDPPVLTQSKTNFTLRARAVDTGGNAAWSDEVNVSLGPDSTAPHVYAATPLGGGASVASVQAFFSEPLNPATVSLSSFEVRSAGADGRPGTADDLLIPGGAVNYHAQNSSASLEMPAPLPPGIYRAIVSSNVTDLAGNRLAADYAWSFRVADGVFWIRATDGLWDDPANWSTGRVPGPADTIYVESIPGDVTITQGPGARSIKKLVLGERVVFNGGLNSGVWQVAESIEIRGTLFLHNATIRGGALRQIESGALVATPHGGNALDAVTLLGDLKLTNSQARLVIRNGLTLAGSVWIDDLATLTFAGTQTFDNAQIVFGQSGQLQLTSGTTLTLGPQLVIRGKSGNIGQGEFGTRNLINQGRISADVAGGVFSMAATRFENQGTLECANGGKVTFIDGLVMNTGRMNALTGGALTLIGSWTNSGVLAVNEATLNLGGTFTLSSLGTLERTGGAINLNGLLDLNGGTLNLDAATGSWTLGGGAAFGTLKGGTLRQTAAARLLVSTGGGTLDAMKVEGDLLLTNSTARVIVRNGLVLNGAAILENAGGLTFSGDQTFSGQITFAGTSGNVDIAPGTTLTLGPSAVVRGKSGSLGAGPFGVRKLINEGVISADLPPGSITISPEQFENRGTLRAEGAGATLTLRVSSLNDSGVTSELNGGRVLINP